MSIVELLLGLLIAAATGLMAAGFILWAPIPAVLAGAILFALRRTDAQIAQALRAAN